MQNVATSVRIPPAATAILAALSGKLGQSKAQVIEKALKDLHERLFWSDVTEAFDHSAADAEAQARQRAEFAVWDKTSAADFRDERW